MALGYLFGDSFADYAHIVGEVVFGGATDGGKRGGDDGKAGLFEAVEEGCVKVGLVPGAGYEDDGGFGGAAGAEHDLVDMHGLPKGCV